MELEETVKENIQKETHKEKRIQKQERISVSDETVLSGLI